MLGAAVGKTPAEAQQGGGANNSAGHSPEVRGAGSAWLCAQRSLHTARAQGKRTRLLLVPMRTGDRHFRRHAHA